MLKTFLLLFVSLLIPWPLMAQVESGALEQTPIPGTEEEKPAPQILLAGEGLATLDSFKPRHLISGGRSSTNQLNFADSGLLLGASQPLFSGMVGSLVTGALFSDSFGVKSGGDQVFFHEGFLNLAGKSFEATLGRSDVPTALLVSFPTLRGEDLLSFTHLLNPFSNGLQDDEHRFSNLASVTFNDRLTYFFNLHAQQLLRSAGGGGTGINSYGFTFQKLPPPGLAPLLRLVTYGAGFEVRTLTRSQGGDSLAFYYGGIVNLRRSMVRRLDFRFQHIVTFGNRLTAFSSLADTFRADSQAIAASLRYHRSPFGKPGYQLALTAGWKEFSKVPGANSYGITLTGIKQLGHGFDFVAQYSLEQLSLPLRRAASVGRTDQVLQIGFAFQWEAVFNRQVGPRRSLLNLQHQYIPSY